MENWLKETPFGIRCKPGGENPIVAATYVSGHLRLWNYTNGQCVGHVTSLITFTIESIETLDF